MGNALWRLSATELATGYRAQSFSPVDALEAILARIAAVNARLNAFVTLDAGGAQNAALASAARWRAGSPLSDLDGVPLSVKDNIPVRGMRATWGSRVYADFVPQADELPIARLRAAGAVILGKTNCPEFTLQGYTDNPLFGPTRNPWNTALTPGGSSGGAVAAVAAGLGPVAIGTDGGGSIRRPVSHTGLVGLKPSRGRVPRCDGFPAILLDYESIGPIARSVADIVLLMRVLSLFDARDPCAAEFIDRPFETEAGGPCRIVFAPTFAGAPVDAEIASSVAAAARTFEQLGNRVEPGEAPFDVDALNQAWPIISQTGLAWLLQSRPGALDLVGEAIAAMADNGAAFTAAQYFGAIDAIAGLRRQLGVFFANHDVLLTPSAAALPWPADESHPGVIDGKAVGPRGHAAFTAIANVTGCPGISVPCAPAANGLPIGFQLIAAPGRDGLLCVLAAQYERAHPWAERWPDL